MRRSFFRVWTFQLTTWYARCSLFQRPRRARIAALPPRKPPPTYLVDHPDARVPEGIYKPFVVPWHEVRVGIGIFDWVEGRGEVSLAYAGDFRHMTGGLLPIPARLALEYGWVPYGRLARRFYRRRKTFVYSTSTMYTGVRVERLITNTQGLYFAVTPKFVDISVRSVNGVISPSPLHWAYGGLSYHFGYVLELPSAHKGNLDSPHRRLSWVCSRISGFARMASKLRFPADKRPARVRRSILEIAIHTRRTHSRRSNSFSTTLLLPPSPVSCLKNFRHALHSHSQFFRSFPPAEFP